jgi:hypothetical protein
VGVGDLEEEDEDELDEDSEDLFEEEEECQVELLCSE